MIHYIHGGVEVGCIWSPQQEDAQRTSFEEILNSVKNDAVLQHPRFHLPLLLDTDASDSGLGAVLSQVIDGVERPIAFASRRLPNGSGLFGTFRNIRVPLYCLMPVFAYFFLIILTPGLRQARLLV